MDSLFTLDPKCCIKILKLCIIVRFKFKPYFRVDEIDLGFTGNWKEFSRSLDVWWSPNKKISFTASLEPSSTSKILLATLTTPFKGYEKQDLKCEINYNVPGETMPTSTMQLSITWGNSHHLTLTSKLGTQCPYLLARIYSTIDKLDNIHLEFKISCLRNEKGFFIFKSPWAENFELTYAVNLSTMHIAVTYGSANFEATVNKGDSFGQWNGKLVIKHPYFKYINLIGVLDYGNSNVRKLEIKGRIGEDEVLLLSTCETLRDRRMQTYMCKANIEFTIGSKNILTLDYDHHLMNGSELKADLDVTSEEFLINTNGHIEGEFNSINAANLKGYINGNRINGKIDFKHSITDSNLASEFYISLNTFNLGYDITGFVDIPNSQINFKGMTKSSIPAINLWNVEVNHNKVTTQKKTTVIFSRGETVLNIDHLFDYTDTFNWSYELVFNGHTGIK